MCAWFEFTPLKHEIQPQLDMDMHLHLLCALECEVLLWAVCSVSPCLTLSVCSDSFVVGWRLLVQQC